MDELGRTPEEIHEILEEMDESICALHVKIWHARRKVDDAEALHNAAVHMRSVEALLNGVLHRLVTWGER